jgi:predicted Rossmann-fold nucleotide-binding protein
VKRICVFCGAAEGVRPAYAEAARRFGAELLDGFAAWRTPEVLRA